MGDKAKSLIIEDKVEVEDTVQYLIYKLEEEKLKMSGDKDNIEIEQKMSYRLEISEKKFPPLIVPILKELAKTKLIADYQKMMSEALRAADLPQQ